MQLFNSKNNWKKICFMKRTQSENNPNSARNTAIQ